VGVGENVLHCCVYISLSSFTAFWNLTKALEMSQKPDEEESTKKIDENDNEDEPEEKDKKK